MSSNRLYIYDEQSHLAVCIAKGYSTGWITGGGHEHVNKFFELAQEFTSDLSKEKPTRLKLKTEDNLPKGCAIFYDI